MAITAVGALVARAQTSLNVRFRGDWCVYCGLNAWGSSWGAADSKVSSQNFYRQLRSIAARRRCGHLSGPKLRNSPRVTQGISQAAVVNIGANPVGGGFSCRCRYPCKYLGRLPRAPSRSLLESPIAATWSIPTPRYLAAANTPLALVLPLSTTGRRASHY